MYCFRNDYSEAAHPKVLKAIERVNMSRGLPYGQDEFSKEASDIIKKLVGDDNCQVHFLMGGTQTNLTAISSFLRPHEAVISADTAHIATHETGAIEATGHKVITVPNKDGKIEVSQIEEQIKLHSDEHMVKPRLVKISNATEVGTVYDKKELEELSNFCVENGLLLYLDGARLGSAIAAVGGDLTFEDVYRYTDAFYIGGTKNGALFGEALLIKNQSLKNDFRYLIKQRGALLAKGKVLGVQFIELFKDGLYLELAQHANEMANMLKTAIKSAGYSLLAETKTNQVFPIFPGSLVEKLNNDFSFEVWGHADNGKTVIRLVTSWATEIEAIRSFADAIKEY